MNNNALEVVKKNRKRVPDGVSMANKITKKQKANKPPVKKAPKKKVVESDADSEDDVSGTSVGCACVRVHN
jgi:hypothetical protein